MKDQDISDVTLTLIDQARKNMNLALLLTLIMAWAALDRDSRVVELAQEIFLKMEEVYVDDDFIRTVRAQVEDGRSLHHILGDKSFEDFEELYASKYPLDMDVVANQLTNAASLAAIACLTDGASEECQATRRGADGILDSVRLEGFLAPLLLELDSRFRDSQLEKSETLKRIDQEVTERDVIRIPQVEQQLRKDLAVKLVGVALLLLFLNLGSLSASVLKRLESENGRLGINWVFLHSTTIGPWLGAVWLLSPGLVLLYSWVHWGYLSNEEIALGIALLALAIWPIFNALKAGRVCASGLESNAK